MEDAQAARTRPSWPLRLVRWPLKLLRTLVRVDPPGDRRLLRRPLRPARGGHRLPRPLLARPALDRARRDLRHRAAERRPPRRRDQRDHRCAAPLGERRRRRHARDREPGIARDRARSRQPARLRLGRDRDDGVAPRRARGRDAGRAGPSRLSGASSSTSILIVGAAALVLGVVLLNLAHSGAVGLAPSGPSTGSGSTAACSSRRSGTASRCSSRPASSCCSTASFRPAGSSSATRLPARS